MHGRRHVLSSISSTVPANYVMQRCYRSCPDTFLPVVMSQRWCLQKQLGKSAAQSIQATNPCLPVCHAPSPPTPTAPHHNLKGILCCRWFERQRWHLNHGQAAVSHLQHDPALLQHPPSLPGLLMKTPSPHLEHKQLHREMVV